MKLPILKVKVIDFKMALQSWWCLYVHVKSSNTSKAGSYFAVSLFNCQKFLSLVDSIVLLSTAYFLNCVFIFSTIVPSCGVNLY